MGCPRSDNVLGFKGQRSRSQGQQHYIITLHFELQSRFFSHSQGGDTCTITLQPRLVIILYSLGGDTDNSNTAWVRTLRVHSSCCSFNSLYDIRHRLCLCVLHQTEDIYAFFTHTQCTVTTSRRHDVTTSRRHDVTTSSSSTLRHHHHHCFRRRQHSPQKCHCRSRLYSALDLHWKPPLLVTVASQLSTAQSVLAMTRVRLLASHIIRSNIMREVCETYILVCWSCRVELYSE